MTITYDKSSVIILNSAMSYIMSMVQSSSSTDQTKLKPSIFKRTPSAKQSQPTKSSSICKRSKTLKDEKIRNSLDVPLEPEIDISKTFPDDRKASISHFIRLISAEFGTVKATLFWMETEMSKASKENGGKIALPSSKSIISIAYNAHEVDISLLDYIKRIYTYSNCEDIVFYYAMIYMQRIKAKHPMLALNKRNVNRLLIGSIVIAAKFVKDDIYPIQYYQKVGGLPTVIEMRKLEITLLQLVQYDLYISPDELKRFLSDLHGNMSKSGKV